MADLLIIDDDQLISKIYKTYFEARNISADTLDSCETAWELIKSNPTGYKAILVDLLLPGMSGLEFIKRTKIEPTTQHIPCIVLTNIVGDATVEQTKSQGALACFFKDHYAPDAIVTEVVKLIPSLVSAPQK